MKQMNLISRLYATESIGNALQMEDCQHLRGDELLNFILAKVNLTHEQYMQLAKYNRESLAKSENPYETGEEWCLDARIDREDYGR